MQRAENVNGTPSITLYQGARIQQAFERAGIRFGRNGAVLRAEHMPHDRERFDPRAEQRSADARSKAESVFRKATTKPITGRLAAEAAVPGVREQVALRID